MMSNISIKNILYIVLIILCLFLAFFLFSHSSKEKYYLPIFNYSVNPIQTKSAAVEESKKCFIQILNDWKKVEPIAWLEIVNLVKMCTKYIINYIPYLETTPHNPEHKYYMIPKIQYMNDSFYVITFGIGGDIDAELNIQMVIPHSKFLGFDPNENYETLFTGNLKGKFFQTAVGGKNVKNTTIMKLTPIDGFKPINDTQIRAAAELIKTYHEKDKLIDILNIDIEGSEYSILEQLYQDKIFQNVCQINVEIHPMWYHNTGYTFYDVIRILKEIIEDGTFIWVKSVVHMGQFFPSYFLNVKNNECIEKYLKDRLL